jgi:hypothetical protein
MTFSSEEMKRKIRWIRSQRYHPFAHLMNRASEKLYDIVAKEQTIMPAETLLTASRRAVRDFNICLNKGGLIDEGLQQTMHTLDKMVRMEADRLKAEEEAASNQLDLYLQGQEGK